MNSPIKASLELSSLGAIVSWWVGALPSIVGFLATLASLAWYSYCLYIAIKRNRVK